MRKIICGIYKITSPSGKIYIGQANNIYKRWSEYKMLKCETQRLLCRSLKKHGAENHNFEIVCECLTEKLTELEIYHIKFFDTFNTAHGLNLTSGGEGGKKSEDTKKVMSEVAFKRWENTPEDERKLSEEHKAKISKSLEGNKYAVGYKHTEETLKILSEKSQESVRAYWDNLKKDPEAYKAVCEKNKESQIKCYEEELKEQIAESGMTAEEFMQKKLEIRKEQKRKAWLKHKESKRYNSEERKIKRNQNGMRSYYTNKEKIIESRKLKRERIRQERLTMIF